MISPTYAVNLPEPEYRSKLRETAAKMDGVSARVHALTLIVDGKPVSADLTPDWQPLMGMEGLESRLIPSAFVVEVRGKAGAGQADVQTTEAAYICPLNGRLLMRRLESETEMREYRPGHLVCLKPGERRAWKFATDYRGLSVFIPAETQPVL